MKYLSAAACLSPGSFGLDFSVEYNSKDSLRKMDPSGWSMLQPYRVIMIQLGRLIAVEFFNIYFMFMSSTQNSCQVRKQ